MIKKCLGNCNNCKKHLGDCKAYEEVFNELELDVKKAIKEIQLQQIKK